MISPTDTADVQAVIASQMQDNTQNSTQQAQKTAGQSEPLLWEEIHAIINQHMMSSPRSLQKAPGPSELGTSCVHCLAARLAGWTKQANPAWLPYIGTSVHAQLEKLFTSLSNIDKYHMDYMITDQGKATPRFVTEYRVYVGRLQGSMGGYDVNGSIDLVDYKTHATCDWKITGSNTITSVKAEGASQQYKVQASLYGIGLENENVEVVKSCIYFLPRNSQTLDSAYPVEYAYDRDLGMWALQRAQLLVTFLDMIEREAGVQMRDQWISSLPRDRDHCFNCNIYKDSGLAEEFTDSEIKLPAKYKKLAALIEPTYKPTK